VAHALHWPDAFDACDRRLQQAAGVADADALRERAERRRPRRGYAALHLLLGFPVTMERAG
jgi:AraC family transcriptional regulator of adaptative response / DNA-3-methyladenine glycosylase II